MLGFVSLSLSLFHFFLSFSSWGFSNLLMIIQKQWCYEFTEDPAGRDIISELCCICSWLKLRSAFFKLSWENNGNWTILLRAINNYLIRKCRYFFFYLLLSVLFASWFVFLFDSTFPEWGNFSISIVFTHFKSMACNIFLFVYLVTYKHAYIY